MTKTGRIAIVTVLLAAVAGVIFFTEPLSAALIVGLVLTVVGFLFMQRRRVPRPAAPEIAKPAAVPQLTDVAPEPVEL